MIIPILLSISKRSSFLLFSTGGEEYMVIWPYLFHLTWCVMASSWITGYYSTGNYMLLFCMYIIFSLFLLLTMDAYGDPKSKIFQCYNGHGKVDNFHIYLFIFFAWVHKRGIGQSKGSSIFSFQEGSILFCIMIALFYFPTYSVWEVSFLHILASILSFIYFWLLL